MTDHKQYWLDRSENVTRLYRGLWLLGIALVVIDLFLHKHEDFGFAAWFGFYAAYGFVACVALVLAAKKLRTLLMRSEDFYDR